MAKKQKQKQCCKKSNEDFEKIVHIKKSLKKGLSLWNIEAAASPFKE